MGYWVHPQEQYGATLKLLCASDIRPRISFLQSRRIACNQRDANEVISSILLGRDVRIYLLIKKNVSEVELL